MIFAQLISLIPLLFFVLVISLHIILAISVYKNASIREREGGQLMFIGPGGWGIAALVCGILALLVYWLIHYSTLASTEARD